MQTDLLTHKINKLGRRLLVRDVLNFIQFTVRFAALVAVLIQIVGRLMPIKMLGIWTISPFVIWLLGVGFNIYRLRPKPMRTAKRVDQELNLQERISTTLALQEMVETFSANLVQAQIQDTLHAAKQINPNQAIAVRWQRTPLLNSAICLAALIALIALPNRMNDKLAYQAAIAQLAKEQASEIEKLYQEIETQAELSAEERDELLKQLEELAKALNNNPGDLEQALADLSRAEEFLQSNIDPNSRMQAANLESLTSQLAALSNQEMQSENFEAAVQALKELANQAEKLDANKRQELAQTLAQLAAQSGQAGDGDLAQALSALSQAVQSGEHQQIEQAAKDVQAAMAQSQAQINQQAIRQQALARLEASSQSLAQAGQSTAQNQGDSPSQNPGQNPGQSQNQGQISGGGSMANTLPPNTGQGQAGIPQGNADSNKAPTDLSAQIYAPRPEEQGNGGPLFIPGQDSNQGNSQVTEGQSSLPGSVGPSLIPYTQVYQNYFDAANQAMQQFYIPPSLEEYVRLYFTQLEP